MRSAMAIPLVEMNGPGCHGNRIYRRKALSGEVLVCTTWSFGHAITNASVRAQ